MPDDSVRFDHFELQPHERRLLVHGVPAALGARAFDVLLLLVARAGSLVTKHELMEQVWAGLVVEEANLTVQVSSLRKVLGGELIATIPGRGYRFTGQVHRATPSAPPSPGTPAEAPAAAPAPAGAGALAAAPAPAWAAAPALASLLVGRAADLQRTAAALAGPGCVTLVGPAGVGKTSLARALAAQWNGGAVWVDLAPLTEGAQVLPAVARALGQPAPDHAARLRAAPGMRLLVLDNAEHLIDAVAALVAALTGPSLVCGPAEPPPAHGAIERPPPLLVTCQLPLAVHGERVLRVEPLPLEDADGAAARALVDGAPAPAEADGALALFIARARAADHRFSPDAASLPLLHRICRQLDGLPLAIEMAAARVPALGLRGLHDALAQRFAVLTRGTRTAAQRHRTLQAALDWSHALLLPQEQRLFRTLAVFAGGFTLELAVAVAADEPQERWAAIDTLASLVDRSLVDADRADPPRYRLLETLRAYAADRLAAAGEDAALRERHARAVSELWERASASDADDRLRAAALAEHDNAREAIAWASRHRPALALTLACRVAALASFTPWRTEAMRWLQACAPWVDDPAISPPVRAAWQLEQARQLLFSERPQDAHREALRARDAFALIGDAHGRFMAGIVMARSGCVAPAELPALCDELKALRESHPHWPARSTQALAGTLAQAYYLLGDLDQHLQMRLEQLELAQALGQQSLVDAAENNVLAALSVLGRHAEALARCETLLERLAGEDSINLAYATDVRLGALAALGRHEELRRSAPAASARLRRFGLATFPEFAAQVLVSEARHAAAAGLVGHAWQLHADFGREPKPSSRSNLAALEQACRAALGDAAFEQRAAEGRTFDEGAALDALLKPPRPGD